MRHGLGVGVGCNAGFRGTAVNQYLQGVGRASAIRLPAFSLVWTKRRGHELISRQTMRMRWAKKFISAC